MADKPGVWLSRIAIEGFGPLEAATFELKRFNLLYGPNESGKTYLVEFLIRSLFRQAADWPLRDQLGVGKVYLEGLGAEVTAFSPGHDYKLEHAWEEEEVGLPLNMARLLVVRGGDLNLASSPSVGANHRILKKALSGEELIDELLEEIQSTVQQAELVEGKIIGSQRGDLKERERLRNELAQIERLQEEVQQRLSGARIEQLKLELARLETKLASMERAKEQRAYELEVEIREIDQKLDQLPADQLELIGQALRDRDRQSADKDRLEQKIAKARAESTNYKWLEQAVEVWQGWQLENGQLRSRWQLLLAAAGILVGLLVAIGGPLSGLSDRPLIISTAVASALVLLGLAILLWNSANLKQSPAAGARAEEKQAIIDEYERRFESVPAGLTDLRLRLEAEREAHSLLKHLEAELADLVGRIDDSETSIRQGFEVLPIQNAENGQWQASLKRVHSERERELKRKQTAELELERLAVPSERRRPRPVEDEFDPEAYAVLQDDLEAVKSELEAAQRDLEGLKGEVTRFTDNSVTDPWEEVLASLWDMKAEISFQYQQLTSKILAEMAITEVLTELRAQEEEKIEAALADSAVSQSLLNITGKYHSISLQSSQLVVRSDTADYNLEDLSTGAQEQVLLALRLGLARRLAGGKPLFLLLDDAFQQADWVRRSRLVSTFIEAAKSGWQITYLTMDDHLRDLIQAEGRQAFGDQFSYMEL